MVGALLGVLVPPERARPWALGLAVAAMAMVVALPAVLVLVFEVVDDALGAGT